MKKTTLKLITTVILSIIISSIFSTIVYAEDCLDDKDKDHSIITIIEESMSVDDYKSDNDNFQIKLCYRVYKKSETDPNKTVPEGTLETTCPNDAANCDPVQVIISKKGGLAMLYGYIGYLYQWIAGFVGLIAVAVIIASGAQISLSGGDADTTSAAKARIIKSISGLAVLFLSSLILYTINPTFFTL